MYSEAALTATQRSLLGLVEYGPTTLSEAAASCSAEDTPTSTEVDAFRAALVKLLCRGLIRPDGESLAITIAGRVALADAAASSC